MQLGVVFWLFSGLVAVLIVATAMVVERLLGLPGSGIGPANESSGVIAVADSLSMLTFLLGGILMATAIPRRILRARDRTLLWLSADGIGYPPVVVGDPGFIGGERVQRVSYLAQTDGRGVVVQAHQWTVYFDNPQKTRTFEYPSGATPRPRRIRRVIDHLIAQSAPGEVPLDYPDRLFQLGDPRWLSRLLGPLASSDQTPGSQRRRPRQPPPEPD
ncbi:hypothetical protein KIH27_00755 [Mycobacterium sp. M1]|uniref:Uncharacterized protein n=1 Tax=Mycolicibacter acidiphilus TaxID=2835306 RepID=A0ABS5RCV1_9MYCO|nr:hypothetical protein [Mycolicibacter acidiphilus]MBS9532112.1 hypothetical protein [Mycolicibacter acidiphilus]